MKEKVEQIGESGRVNVEEEADNDKKAGPMTFERLLKDPPVKTARKNKDEYVQVEGMLVRIHRNKRKALFTPKGTLCPVDPFRH